MEESVGRAGASRTRAGPATTVSGLVAVGPGPVSPASPGGWYDADAISYVEEPAEAGPTPGQDAGSDGGRAPDGQAGDSEGAPSPVLAGAASD